MMFNYHVQTLSKRARAKAKAKALATRKALHVKRQGRAAASVARHQPRTPEGLRNPVEALIPTEEPEEPEADDDSGEGDEVGADAPVGPVLVISTPGGRQLACRLHYLDGKLAAELRAPGGGRWLAVVDLRELRREVLASLADRPGWGWGDIKKAAGKLAKRAGIKKLATSVYNAATSGPIGAGLKLVAPQLGLSVAALKKVSSIYEQASRGAKPALAAVKAIRAAAETGSPSAIKAATALVYLRADEKARAALDLSPGGGGAYGRTIDTMNNAYQLGLGLLSRQHMAAA